MRVFLSILILAVPPVLAQESSAPADCHVVLSTPVVTEDGRFERPAPTPGQCEAAAALIDRFLATPANDFRWLFNINAAPQPVINYIVSVVGRGQSRNPGNFQTGNFEQRTGLSVWLSAELVLMAYRGSDYSGSSTTVTLADLDSLTACEYLRWEGTERPEQLSVRDVQEALDSGLTGRRQTPVCQLGALPLD